MTPQVEQSNHDEGPRSRRQLASWRRARALVGLSAVAAILVACGNTATTTPGSGGGSGSRSSSVDLPAPKQWVIKAADLPPDWRDSNPPEGDFRVTVCGVDLEPVLATRAGAWRWSQSGVGPFLEQHVRVYRDDQAQKVISALQASLPTCTKTEVPRSKNSPEKVAFTIKPITVAGAGPDSVAWRQTLVSARPITSEIVLTRRGRTAVLFNSYTLGSVLDRDVLARAVAALQVTPLS